jgi:hypothetical protein
MYPTRSIISQESISGPAYQDHHRLERQLAQSPLLLLDLHLTITHISYLLGVSLGVVNTHITHL